MGKMLSSLLTLVALAYGGIAALLFFSQEKLAYYPQIGREIQSTPRDHGLDYEPLTLNTADGERLDAWFIPAPQTHGTALILHGNAGNMSHRMDTVAMFHRLGYSVLIFDYRGYGRSSGKPSEQGLYQDAQTAWNHLTRQRSIAPTRIILFGESLGGAVAAWLAARERPGRWYYLQYSPRHQNSPPISTRGCWQNGWCACVTTPAARWRR